MVGLTLHENIPRLLPACLSAPYLEIAELFAEADGLDRTGFQRQVAQLNELSSILKNVCTASVVRGGSVPRARLKAVCEDTRFTRVLTKYSTEFSNLRFIQSACIRTGLDKRSLRLHWLRQVKTDKQKDNNSLASLTSLEISRLERYFAPRDRECA